METWSLIPKRNPIEFESGHKHMTTFGFSPQFQTPAIISQNYEFYFHLPPIVTFLFMIVRVFIIRFVEIYFALFHGIGEEIVKTKVLRKKVYMPV